MAFLSPFHKPNWPLARIPRALAALFFIASAQAQQPSLPAVTINERSSPPADVTGFGDVPLREVPISATVIGRAQIEAVGARRLADLTRLDASVTDAYNSPGYWDYLTIRGFELNNRYNYRREGLPISAETTIPLDNKERIEILKGTSGIQAGTSAPGGLVNYVVKRPPQQDLREVRLEASSRSSVLAAADLGGRFGAERAFGWRLNAAQERLRPTTRNLDGERSLLAAAGDWRISRDSVLEGELEWSRRGQASQAGFSLLGNALPAVPDPRLNLSNQPWAQPSEFDALTGTVRFEQALNAQWRWSGQLGRQSLRTNDRLAFAFGCAAEGNFDRYCSNGTFDLYDFRSDGERRRQDAVALNLKGKIVTGSVSHDLGFGILNSRVRNRFQANAFNFAGIGNVQGTAIVPANPALTSPSTNRDERSLEFSAQDVIRWTERITTWVGLRHTRLDRESVRTDGSQASSYQDGLTTPWLAASYKFGGGTLAYASWGQGVESEVVPNLVSQYANAGVGLPALKSRQWEIGLKGGQDGLQWQVDWFNIHRPIANLDACARLFITPCIGAYDGQAVHQGLEANAQWAQGPWRLGGSLTLLGAKRQGSTAEPGVNGKRPTNVPAAVLRLNAGWNFASAPGLALDAWASHEGRREVVPGGAISLPAWTRLDAALKYETKVNGVATRWALGVDNLLDRRYWKESPYKFGHVYLYPGAVRTVRLSVTAAL